MSADRQMTVAATATPVAGEQPSARWGLVGLAVASLLSTLGISIANIALPTLAQTFSATFQEVQWVVLAYLLLITTMSVSAGRLGDVIGRRRRHRGDPDSKHVRHRFAGPVQRPAVFAPRGPGVRDGKRGNHV